VRDINDGGIEAFAEITDEIDATLRELYGIGDEKAATNEEKE